MFFGNSHSYKYKTTGLITKAFDRHSIKYRVANNDDTEVIGASFLVDGGPTQTLNFIVINDKEGVGARIFRLVTSVPSEKRIRVLEVCNLLNNEVRYLRFSLDADGDINVEYDIPANASDDCIGEMAFEILARTISILDAEYAVFMKAIYSDEEIALNDLD